MFNNEMTRRDFHRLITILATARKGGVPAPLLSATAMAAATPLMRLPVATDTIFSPRSPSPQALPIIDAYRPNRAEWHYARSAAFIQQTRKKGVSFVSGTINSTDVPDADISVGISGAPNIAPWMRGNINPHPFINSGSARSRQALADWVQRNLDMGVDGIAFDDPLPLASAESWAGGDFSAATQTMFLQWVLRHHEIQSDYGAMTRADNFRHYLAQTGVNDIAAYRARRNNDPALVAWRNFLLDLDIGLIKSLRSRQYRGIASPMFCGNLNSPKPSEQAERLMPLFDYFVSEINSDEITDVYIAANMLATRGKPLVASSKASSNDTKTLQHSIAASFAVGAIPVIPWDIYVPPHGGKPMSRYYGNPTDFVPIFDFFRRNASFLIEYKYLPQVGIAHSIGQTSMQELRESVRICVRKGVAFRILVCGGELTQRSIRTDDLSGLKGVIDPGGHLSPANTAILKSAAVPLTQTVLDAPVVDIASFPLAKQWCAIPLQSSKGRRAYFLVPSTYGTASIKAGTRLVIQTELPSMHFSPTLITLSGTYRLLGEFEPKRCNIALPAFDQFAIVLI